MNAPLRRNQMSLAKALLDWMRASDRPPRMPAAPRGFDIVVTAQKIIVSHRAPVGKGQRKKGERPPTREVEIKRAFYVDCSRYSGAKLREIRARAVNFNGEVQR